MISKEKFKLATVTIIFVVLSSTIIFSLYFSLFPKAPVGWDAPYYVYKNQVLGESGLANLVEANNGVRVGYTIFSLLVRTVTGASSLVLELVLPYFLITCISLGMGLLIYLDTKKLSYLFLTYLVSVFSFLLNDLALRNNSDNLFAVTLLVLAIIVFVFTHNKRPLQRSLGATCIGILAFIIGVTHLESLLLFDIIVFLTLLQLLAVHIKGRSITFTFSTLIILVSIFAANLGTFFAWHKYLKIIFGSYQTTQNIAQAVHSTNDTIQISSFILNNRMHGLDFLAPFLLLGVIVFLFNWKKERSVSITIIISWFLALVFLFEYFQGKNYPPNYLLRLIQLMPLVPITILGAIMLFKRISIQRVYVISTLLIFISIVNIVNVYSKDKHMFIPLSAYIHLSALKNAIDKSSKNHTYVFVSTPLEEPDVWAYYLMWNNWILSSVSSNKIDSTEVLLGNPEKYKICELYDKSASEEYRAIANKNIENFCRLKKDSNMFVFKDFFDSKTFKNLKKGSFVEVGGGIYQFID